ncbi:POK7 protein, partial [Nyctibius grandis]|nr:POK7 protein [Nyctibius grandis]
VELSAVVCAFEKWSEPINIITDSAYVTGLVEQAEGALLRDIENAVLFQLLKALVFLLTHRTKPYFVLHIRAHTTLPGPLVEGNRQADNLTLPVQVVPDRHAQARLSHAFYHQNARALCKQFSLTARQAQDIISACADCQRHRLFTSQTGVNP